MVSREKDNHFLLTGNVEIRATNMIATCEQLKFCAETGNISWNPS